MPKVDGDPIDQSTVFDLATIIIIESVLHNVLLWDTTQAPPVLVGRLRQIADPYTHWVHLDENDREYAEIQRRISAGTLKVTYGYTPPGVDILTIPVFDWLGVASHAFARGGMDHFFLELVRGGSYQSPATNSPQEFHFPGRVVDGRRTVYKRDNDTAIRPMIRPTADDASLLVALFADGWHPNPPAGHELLQSMDVERVGDGLVLSAPQRVWRTTDKQARIRKIARAYYAWTDTVTPTVKTGTPYTTVHEDFTMKIGRAWTFTDPTIDVKRTFSGGSLELRGASMEDWLVGNMEYWLDRGLDTLLTLVNTTSLSVYHDDRDMVLIAPDGAPSEILVHDTQVGAPTDSQWTTWRTTDYNAALGTVVTIASGLNHVIPPDQTTARFGATEHILNGVGTTTYLWERVSGEGGSLDNAAILTPLFTKPTLAVGDPDRDIVFRLTVTNNGESDSLTVTIRIEAPEAPEE